MKISYKLKKLLENKGYNIDLCDDILYDICVNFSYYFFGDNAHEVISTIIIAMSNGNSQDDIETYILNNCKKIKQEE